MLAPVRFALLGERFSAASEGSGASRGPPSVPGFEAVSLPTPKQPGSLEPSRSKWWSPRLRNKDLYVRKRKQ